MGWRDWRGFTWLDRLDQWGPAGPDRAAQAQPYSEQPVLAASVFGPNLPQTIGPFGLVFAIARWLAVRRGHAPAERFVLAVTNQELLILRTGWAGRRMKALLDRWECDDIVASRLGRISDSFAISVENRRLGRRFEAKAFIHSDEAAKVIGLLTGA